MFKPKGNEQLDNVIHRVAAIMIHRQSSYEHLPLSKLKKLERKKKNSLTIISFLKINKLCTTSLFYLYLERRHMRNYSIQLCWGNLLLGSYRFLTWGTLKRETINMVKHTNKKNKDMTSLSWISCLFFWDPGVVQAFLQLWEGQHQLRTDWILQVAVRSLLQPSVPFCPMHPRLMPDRFVPLLSQDLQKNYFNQDLHQHLQWPYSSLSFFIRYFWDI